MITVVTWQGWEQGGLLWAILYGLAALLLSPFFLVIGAIAIWALYAVLAVPGAFVATQLDWTKFSIYAGRRRALRTISVVAILTPLLIYQPRQVWELLTFFGSLVTLVLLIAVVAMIVLSLILMRRFVSAVSQDDPNSELATTFRWTKPDPPRLPPPSDEPFTQ